MDSVNGVTVGSALVSRARKSTVAGAESSEMDVRNVRSPGLQRDR